MKNLCKLCKRASASNEGYCTYHYRGYSQIIAKYVEWKFAYEDISWERYLETIAGRIEIGDLAKAVVVDLLRSER